MRICVRNRKSRFELLILLKVDKCAYFLCFWAINYAETGIISINATEKRKMLRLQKGKIPNVGI